MMTTESATLRPRSHEAFAEARRYIPGGVNSPVRAFRGVGGEPFFVTRAEAAHIYDVDGREYVDFVGTWGPAILGHAPAVVVEAVRAAAGRGLSFGIPKPGRGPDGRARSASGCRPSRRCAWSTAAQRRR